MRDKLAVHALELARRKRGGENDPASPGLQVFNHSQGHILHFLLTLEKMHVFQQQDIQFLQTAFKSLHVMAAQGGHKTRGEFLGRKIGHARAAAVPAEALAHGLGQMRLAEARGGVHKQRPHVAAATADVLRGGHGHAVAGPHHKIFETIAPSRFPPESRRNGGHGQAGLPPRQNPRGEIR